VKSVVYDCLVVVVGSGIVTVGVNPVVDMGWINPRTGSGLANFVLNMIQKAMDQRVCLAT